jgi:uncharacterized protein YndB with AHSA1/START domain
MADSATTRELVITRTFNAPRELVYRAFVDPDQLAQWFGPVGYSVPRNTVEVDVRPGGYQRFVMISDDDPTERAPVNATFREVVENELLVGMQEVEGIPGMMETVQMYLRVEFFDEDGKTRLVLRQGPYTDEMAGMAHAGWESSFTKLDVLLAA